MVGGLLIDLLIEKKRKHQQQEVEKIHLKREILQQAGRKKFQTQELNRKNLQVGTKRNHLCREPRRINQTIEARKSHQPQDKNKSPHH